MLYELLSPYAGELNLFSFITFRAGLALATALILTLIFGHPMILWLRKKQGKGQPIRERWPGKPPVEEGHAHDGRLPDPVRHRSRHAAVGRPQEPVCLDRLPGDAGFRRGRLHRRLPEGHQEGHDGPLRQGAAADGVRDRGRRGLLDHAVRAADGRSRRVAAGNLAEPPPAALRDVAGAALPQEFPAST